LRRCVYVGFEPTPPLFSVFLDRDWWWVYPVENIRIKDDERRKVGLRNSPWSTSPF
jgi:hypothetical protein